MTSVEKFIARPGLADLILRSCSQATRITKARSASVSMCMRLSLSWMSCWSNSSRPPWRALLAGAVAYAKRVGGELEIAEQAAAGGVAALAAALLHGAADVADDVVVRHPRVLEDQLGVLVEAPAALVEHLSDAEAGRVARHHEHRGALAQRDIGIGAHVEEEQLSHAAVGDEAFLAVEDPFVAVALAAQLQAGLGIVVGRQPVVGTGARLADALAQHIGVVGQERFQEPFLLRVGAHRSDQVTPFPALAEGFRDRAVGLGQFRHDQRLGDEVGAVAAPFRRHRHGAEAKPRALADDLPVEGLARVRNVVAFERDGTDFVACEGSGLHLPVALLVVEGEVHGVTPNGRSLSSLSWPGLSRLGPAIPIGLHRRAILSGMRGSSPRLTAELRPGLIRRRGWRRRASAGSRTAPRRCAVWPRPARARHAG